jgi:hypothetical protein
MTGNRSCLAERELERPETAQDEQNRSHGHCLIHGVFGRGRSAALTVRLRLGLKCMYVLRYALHVAPAFLHLVGEKLRIAASKYFKTDTDRDRIQFRSYSLRRLAIPPDAKFAETFLSVSVTS